MQINQQALSQQIKKKIAPVTVLIGQDQFLINEGIDTLKTAIKNQHHYDEKKIRINAPEDWNEVLEEANSYSLFSDIVLLNIDYDKKSLDATGKKVLMHYLNHINSRCFIIIKMPQVPAKQISWLSEHSDVLLVVAYTLNAEAMKHWIISQLKNNALSTEPQVPELIIQYTQGNMLACAQVIEKIVLSQPESQFVTSQHAMEHLTDQCDLSLFELADACLLGQSDKALHILRYSKNNKTEATLVLWILSQEIRLLLQLNFHMTQNMNFKNACSQLKIWPQRTPLYQKALNRLNIKAVQTLLNQCLHLDEQIKSSSQIHIWDAFERLSLSLCMGLPCLQ